MTERAETHWAIVVGLHNWDLTEQAIKDLLAQTAVNPRVLYVDQGSDDATRQAAKDWATREPRLLVWCHDPALPSLSATWNLALRFAWRQGAQHALVVNNDVRLLPITYERLKAMQQTTDALFVSAVGWDERRWCDTTYSEKYNAGAAVTPEHRGGPDFSCFLLTQSGHWKYPFDESFIPAYCEDLDLHRRYMLAGDGDRIFSVNLPYLHYASRTLAAFSPEQRAAWLKRIDGSRSYYNRKWGGPVNMERYTIPFDAGTDQAGVTTPELQAAGREVEG